MVLIHTGKLQDLSSTLQNTPLSSLNTLLYQLYQDVNDTQLLTQIQSIHRLYNQLEKDIQQTTVFLTQTIQKYEKTEGTLQKKASEIAFHTSLSSNHKTSMNPPLFNVKKDVGKVVKRFHTSFSNDKSILSYLKNGACVGYFAGIDALTYSIKKDMKYFHANAGVSIGKATVSTDAKITLFENKKFRPALFLEAEGFAALAQAKASVSIGNSYVHVDGEASVGVGVVSGSAKAVINKEEITLKANVGAAAVRGEAKGSFTIFGWKVTATGTAEAGAIGAGVEYSSKKGEFTIGTRASFIAGLGFKLKFSQT